MLLCANSHTSLRVFNVACSNAEVENIQEAIKKRVVSPEISIDGKNPSLLDENKRSEVAISVLPEGMLEEHLMEMLKDYRFLEDVPVKTRKEEALKPLHLTRYE